MSAIVYAMSEVAKSESTSSTAEAPHNQTEFITNEDKFNIHVFESSSFHAVTGRQSARAYNQDYFLCRPTFPCTCRRAKEYAHSAAIYLVSDGHGESGETAAEKSSTILESLWRNEMLPTLDANDTQSTMQALKSVFHKTDERLVRQIDPRGGTTCTVAFIHENNLLYIGNVGDSSAKLYRRRIRDENGQIVQLPNDPDDASNENSWKLDDGIGAKPELIERKSLISIEVTTDHKPEDSNETSRIKKLGGAVIEHNGIRVEGVLNMSRALGNQDLKPYVCCEPSIRVIPLSNDDKTGESILILASDGLWAYCPENRILSAMNRASKFIPPLNGYQMEAATPSKGQHNSTSGEGKPRKIAEELGELAKRHRSADNLTIIAVMLDEYFPK